MLLQEKIPTKQPNVATSTAKDTKAKVEHTTELPKMTSKPGWSLIDLGTLTVVR